MASMAEHDDAHENRRSQSRAEQLTAAQKATAVLRVLRGESVEAVSEDLGVSIRRLERWQSEFVTAGSAALTKRTDLHSKSWLSKHSGSIVQWIWLLLALIVVISLLAVFMQRGSTE
jgi:hypothetical protein